MSVSTPLYINYSENGVLHHITIYTIPYHPPWDRELTGAPLISYAVSHSSGRQQRQPRPGPHDSYRCPNFSEVSSRCRVV